MYKIMITTVVCWGSIALSVSALAFFKVPDTDFGEPVSEAVAYETKSLLMKFNYKTNDLKIGPYTGTWKNRKSSSKFFGFDKRKTSTDITLIHESYGTWTMFCSGSLKGLSFGGISFDRENKIDYQCVMQRGDEKLVLEILPYKKPKFALGAPMENRSVKITLPDGAVMQAVSIHDLTKTKRKAPTPVGYRISKGESAVGWLGRYEKKQVILIGAEVADTLEAHYVFMTGLALQFFTNNSLKK